MKTKMKNFILVFGLFVGVFISGFLGAYKHDLTISGTARKNDSYFHDIFLNIPDDTEVSVWTSPSEKHSWAIFIYGRSNGILITNYDAKHIISNIGTFLNWGAGVWSIPFSSSEPRYDLSHLRVDNVDWQRLK